jgi:3-oxoacyl-[acyl-carrier protein] reductase
MDFGIKGKVAIVTGTNRKGAMGAAIATTLAKEGADIACVDIVMPGCEEVAKSIRDLGRRAIAVKADQSDYEQVKAAVAKIKAELGPPEILVNNAALLRGGGRIDKTTVEDWKNLMKIDLDGPWYWIREVWESMVEKKFGRIINISSIAGVQGGFGQANYSSAKGAVISLAKTAALEGARLGITANVVTLGVTCRLPRLHLLLERHVAGRHRGDRRRVELLIALRCRLPCGNSENPQTWLTCAPICAQYKLDISQVRTFTLWAAWICSPINLAISSHILQLRM